MVRKVPYMLKENTAEYWRNKYHTLGRAAIVMSFISTLAGIVVGSKFSTKEQPIQKQSIDKNCIEKTPPLKP